MWLTSALYLPTRAVLLRVVVEEILDVLRGFGVTLPGSTGEGVFKVKR